MAKTAAAAIPLLLVLVACGGSPTDRVVTPDGQLIVGTITSLDGSGIEIDGLSVPAPTGEAARVTLASGATYLGVVSGDGRAYTLRTDMGDVDLKPGQIASIYWPPTESATDLVDVPANGTWYNTHLMAAEGASITVAASGRAAVDTGLSGPGGQDRFSSANAQVPEATSGQLVMRVGEDGTPLPVGDSYSGPVDGAGEVYLAVNAPPDSTAGYYTVSLVVSAPAGTGHWAVYPHGK
jgi:hypothetical protein